MILEAPEGVIRDQQLREGVTKALANLVKALLECSTRTLCKRKIKHSAKLSTTENKVPVNVG